ncbi:MAG: hypothetical protein AB2814_08585, partial [Candidatus Sedimenticola endophacoides]
MQFHKAGANHVNEVANSNRNLIEKAFYMRYASYLAHVKAQLLTKHGKSTLRKNPHYVASRYASFSKYRIPPGY